MTTLALERLSVRAIVRQVVIALCFGALYFGLTSMNPALAKSIGAPFGLTFRFANVLQPFVLWLGPAVPIGILAGSTAFNLGVGDVFPVVPLINACIGLGIWQVSRLWGRSTRNDLVLVVAHGVLTGLVVSLKLTGWALLIAPETWRPLLAGAVTLKLVTHVSMFVVGYPLARAFERWLKR